MAIIGQLVAEIRDSGAGNMWTDPLGIYKSLTDT
jgi:hypothetical protein